MGKPLSMDLRERVVAAIAGGLSCRAAAAQFSVSASSAIRWWKGLETKGSVAPEKIGGDRKSGRIEAQAPFILREVAATPDITLAELRDKLIARGACFGIATLWRFFERRGITVKKRASMRPSSSAST